MSNILTFRTLFILIFGLALVLMPFVLGYKVINHSVLFIYLSISTLSMLLGVSSLHIIKKFYLLIIPFAYTWCSVFSGIIYISGEVYSISEGDIIQNMRLSRYYSYSAFAYLLIVSYFIRDLLGKTKLNEIYFITLALLGCILLIVSVNL
jgi:hypothetical protein